MPKPKVTSKKPASKPRAGRAMTRSSKASKPTKQQLVITMLRRKRGVTIDDIAEKTGWQSHSVRGFCSGLVKKKLRLPLISEVGNDGVRRYRIAAATPREA
jgi:hypothetical protein